MRATPVSILKLDFILQEEEERWEQLVARIDMVPEKHDYYDNLPLRPGFEFWKSLLFSRLSLDKLRLNVPDTLYINELSYHLYTGK